MPTFHNAFRVVSRRPSTMPGPLKTISICPRAFRVVNASKFVPVQLQSERVPAAPFSMTVSPPRPTGAFTILPQRHAEFDHANLWRCPVCDVVVDDQHRGMHMVRHGQRVCEVCSKSFPDKCSLTRHMRVHNGERPFQCTICSVRFAQKGNLATHMKVHSVQKQYSCQECGASYQQKSSLTKHQLRTHDVVAS
ncbi:hypothetical protein PBRA_002425 [Plasmodiophora brassicae]|nr:hypothetical protein PBRA_002425 [Plasmodiophora brassicae]